MNVHVSNDEADSVRAPNLVSPLSPILYYALQTEARFLAYICKYGHQRMDEAGADRSEREGSEARLFGMRPPPDTLSPLGRAFLPFSPLCGIPRPNNSSNRSTSKLKGLLGQ